MAAVAEAAPSAVVQNGSAAEEACTGTETPTAPLSLPVLPGGSSTHMAYLIEQSQPCVLRPFCFFVSWQGVVTLAFKGFPSQLVCLKGDLPNYYSGLPPENPGSRWPKTSLGALRDGKRLSPEQLQTLMRICTECSGVFQAPGSPKQQAVLVDRLAAVIYECRSLERQISKHVIHMRGGRSRSAGGEVSVDVSEPSEDERARVDKVLREADDDDYWFHASKDGNRESHYRGTALGATLVHELSCFNPGEEPGPANGDRKYSAALPDIIRRFRARVDVALPGMYAWWAESSLHVTVRALCG